MASIIAGAAHRLSPRPRSALRLSGAVGVPGAFTGTCSAQILGYIDNYEAFKAKGVTGVYVVAVNVQFLMKKRNWRPRALVCLTRLSIMREADWYSAAVRFLADGQGEFVGATGLVFDATPLLGGPRSKLYVMIVKNQEVTSVAVEEDPSKVTITDAKTILAQL
ncbi:Redoxin [Armillaria luteobubalina]|uniref:Redoxin n=1 Tax=Armillaria luteobubalina TaxID=153913 RepID=A0AA39PSR4_9AGAR|nr:Redoxin [Armillaria luteobubalina]